VLDRQRSEVSVRNQIAVHAWRRQKSRQYFGVAMRGCGNPCRPTVQLCVHLLPCVRHAERVLEHPRAGDQPQKGQQGRPRQTHTRGVIDPLIEPPPCGGVLGLRRVDRINQQVGIHQDQ
jgi:hypothetical protein